MDTALRKRNTLTLETIMETDQQAIKDFRAGEITASDLTEINRKNVTIVKKIITEIGFPTINLTSQKAYKAAVLVVLHSGDIDFLSESIKNLQNSDPTSIQKRDIAYMIDKSRVIQKLPQLYGTQYNIDNDGVLKYIEIEKPEDLEKRRAEYGMESFEEYKKIVEKSLRTK
ncbi:MAG: DUF6624 domain-containing protein [Candidatus Paceibacterota bacterium]|jgi:hypothetical protein